MKSIEYVEKAKKDNEWSDYRLSKEIGISRQAMSKIVNGKNIMSNYVASKIAIILGLNEMEVIAQCSMERAHKESERKFWKKKLESLSKVAACLILTAKLATGAGFQHGEDPKNTKIYQISAITVIFLYFYIFA